MVYLEVACHLGMAVWRIRIGSLHHSKVTPEMVYLEFTECHGAIGSFQRPDPYNVLDMRLDSFLSEDVVPPCKQLPRFRGKGLWDIPKPGEDP